MFTITVFFPGDSQVVVDESLFEDLDDLDIDDDDDPDYMPGTV